MKKKADIEAINVGTTIRFVLLTNKAKKFVKQFSMEGWQWVDVDAFVVERQAGLELIEQMKGLVIK